MDEQDDTVRGERYGKLEHLALGLLAVAGKEQHRDIAVLTEQGDHIVDQKRIVWIVSMLNNNCNDIAFSGTQGGGEVITDIAKLIGCFLNSI